MRSTSLQFPARLRIKHLRNSWSSTPLFNTSPAMLLLELPAELIQKILVQALLARGVNRGLRLRLVCSKFAHFLVNIAEITVQRSSRIWSSLHSLRLNSLTTFPSQAPLYETGISGRTTAASRCCTPISCLECKTRLDLTNIAFSTFAKFRSVFARRAAPTAT
jgi:hypothetical protein